MIAIVPLVLLTAGCVGYLGYRNLAAVAIERNLASLDASARSQAVELSNLVKNVRADVKGFRSIVGLEEIMALSRDSSLQTLGGRTLAEWRARIGQRFAGELEAKPALLKYRLIGVADGGREVIRVERRPDGVVRVVPDGELQRKGERGFYEQAIQAAPDEIVISPAELNQDYGVISEPHTPVVRVSAPLFAEDGTRFGVLVVNIDLSGAFRQLTRLARQGVIVYVVNDRGDYLLHPDKSREFGFEWGRPSRIQDDFPSLAAAIAAGEQKTAIVKDRNGAPFGVALEHADGVRLSVLGVLPQQHVLDAITAAWLNSSVIGGSVAVLIAVLLGIVLARTMTRPLSQMTKAVTEFSVDKPLRMPVDASGEIGLLARAFDRMVQEVSAKNAAIRHEKETFESIMATMAECVLMISLDRKIVYENRANRELLGAHGSSVDQWRDSYELYEADGTTRLSREDWPSARALRGENYDNYELVLRRPRSARSIHLAGSARPLRDATGAMTGAVIVFRDVTEIRATEHRLHQAQKLEAIGQLTGGVAHDFNNVLTVISGTAEILLDELKDKPDLVSIARMIEQAAERGADLTRQLLAFARKQPLQPRNVDVNAVVIDAERLLRTTIGEHIEVEVQLQQDLETAEIDPSLLSSALLNLAVNARDAMPKGGKLLLETSMATLDESYATQNPDVPPGRYVMVAVSDTGTGIPAKLRDKVFEPFFTTKGISKGTGLGLSMVYGFVKQSGGHVKLYSEEGHGTTIKLYLPCGDACADAIVPAAPVEGGRETILLVEDDELVRKFAIAQLDGLGYHTIAVCDGPAALQEALRGTPFDLLFTDVIMPGGLNGPQLADAIARIRPVKVLYTSGYTENAIVHHGRLDPGVRLLAKPYRRADMARMVRSALGDPDHVPSDDAASARASVAG